MSWKLINNGKGSKPRPFKNIKEYSSNWDQINWSKNNLKNMKIQIRKVESITILRATKAIEVDIKKFKNKKLNNPFTGETKEQFAEYLSDIWPYGLPEDLDDKTIEALESLNEMDMEEFYCSVDKCENSWLEVGEVDPSFRKSGGFKVIASTER